MEIIKGKKPGAWIACIYGIPGVGKGELASFAPKALFADLEGGLDRIDCERTSRIKDWASLMRAFQFFVNSDYQTLVIDTATELESIIIDEMIRVIVDDKTGKSFDSYAGITWGRGPGYLKEWWQKIVRHFETIKAAGKNVLIIGHAEVKKVDDPTLDSSYDSFAITMEQKQSHGFLIGKLESVMFMHFQTYLKNEDKKSEKTRAKSNDVRILEVKNNPAWTAKNRFDLTEPIVVPTRLQGGDLEQYKEGMRAVFKNFA